MHVVNPLPLGLVALLLAIPGVWLAGRFAAAGPEGGGQGGNGEAPIGASDLVRAVQAAFRAVVAEGL